MLVEFTALNSYSLAQLEHAVLFEPQNIQNFSCIDRKTIPC